MDRKGLTFQSVQMSPRYVRSISMLFLALSIEMRLNILLNLFGRHPVDRNNLIEPALTSNDLDLIFPSTHRLCQEGDYSAIRLSIHRRCCNTNPNRSILQDASKFSLSGSWGHADCKCSPPFPIGEFKFPIFCLLIQTSIPTNTLPAISTRKNKTNGLKSRPPEEGNNLRIGARNG